MVGIGIRLINLVQSDNNGHFGGLGVVDGFTGLRHDTVVSRYDYDGDMGDMSSSCTHSGKCFVTWCIQEGDFLAIDFNLVSADVLGDSACFSGRYFGFTYSIKKRRFPVVYVAHYCDNRRNNDHVVFIACGYHCFVRR